MHFAGWTGNAATYGFDLNRIVVSGHSAGGHLTLTTGMLPASAGLDRRCPARNPGGGFADAHEPEMRVAAMVNWYGITDVAGSPRRAERQDLLRWPWMGAASPTGAPSLSASRRSITSVPTCRRS